jgi:hypothetical protein
MASKNNVANAEANSADEYLKEFCEQTSTDLNGRSLNVGQRQSCVGNICDIKTVVKISI